jgi:hypothetical protein
MPLSLPRTASSSSTPLKARSRLQPQSAFNPILTHLGIHTAFQTHLHGTNTQSRNAKKFAETTDAYSLDVGKYPVAKDHFKIEKTPTAIVYKNGEELKRVDGTQMSPEKMKEVEELLLG